MDAGGYAGSLSMSTRRVIAALRTPHEDSGILSTKATCSYAPTCSEVIHAD